MSIPHEDQTEPMFAAVTTGGGYLLPTVPAGGDSGATPTGTVDVPPAGSPAHLADCERIPNGWACRTTCPNYRRLVGADPLTVTLTGAPFSDLELSVSNGHAYLMLGRESRPLSVDDRRALVAWLAEVDDALGCAL